MSNSDTSVEPDDPDPHSHHHGSHRGLLRAVRIVRPADGWIDVIAVPSSRPAVHLREAVRLARHLDCVLLVLASGRCSARDVVNRYGDQLPGRLLAVDVAVLPESTEGLLRFEADEVALRTSPRPSDISRKRNLALLIARGAGARRMLFLDDDIVVPHWVDILRTASALSTKFAVAGMDIKGYPDNSVVCHAHRLTGGDQDTFVGGGALVLNPQKSHGFFPDLYNEDWFFLVDHALNGSVAIAGRAAQRPYDPFETPARAQREEFGDVLAEGLFWLLDEGMTTKGADRAFWEKALRRRREFIDAILCRQPSSAVTPQQRRRMQTALAAAHEVSESIPAAACVEYVEAWNRDTSRWAGILLHWPTDLTISAVLRRLGLRWFGSAAGSSTLNLGPRSKHRALPDPLEDLRGRPVWIAPTPMALATRALEPPSASPLGQAAATGDLTLESRLSPDSAIGVGAQ